MKKLYFIVIAVVAVFNAAVAEKTTVCAKKITTAAGLFAAVEERFKGTPDIYPLAAICEETSFIKKINRKKNVNQNLL